MHDPTPELEYATASTGEVVTLAPRISVLLLRKGVVSRYTIGTVKIQKAMLLAAGEGQRLRPLTDHVPKPMLEIAGRPILEHNVRMLARYGVNEIIINVHHLPETITSHFGDGSRFGVHIMYSHEDRLLGTAGAVKTVEAHFDSTFLVVFGDNLTTCDVSRLGGFHFARAGVATIALFHREDAASSGIAALDEYDRILRFVEKPKPQEVFSNWVNAGLLVLEPEVLATIPAGAVSDFGRDVFPKLTAGPRPVYGYRMTEGLWWIDSIGDYERTRKQADKGAIELT